jgi:hypothetical protein
MLFEQILFISGSLNSGTCVSQALTDTTPLMAGIGNYRPTKVFITNSSGKSANFGLWTAAEYTKWLADKSISTLMSLASAASLTLENIKGEISYVTASGSSGHTGSLSFIFARE